MDHLLDEIFAIRTDIESGLYRRAMGRIREAIYQCGGSPPEDISVFDSPEAAKRLLPPGYVFLVKHESPAVVCVADASDPSSIRTEEGFSVAQALCMAALVGWTDVARKRLASQ